ncbi:MAG TPA: DUF2911 domain-containing protein [Thermoanaerobaculia bacterium]|nr:DUF2911 domain-containing protein [Thermoanaerobaculia bacterium]
MIRRNLLLTLSAMLLSASVLAQGITLPPSGDNQKASVSQHIGPVVVTIDYSSPDVHAPNGADRRGKIWGGLVPYGMVSLGIGTCGDQCPWRVGANENTVLSVTHDVLVEGRPLPAGRYGVHMIAQEGDWTLILSRDADSWGSYYYDAANDALRVPVTPAKSEYHEWLTWEFTDRRPDRATVALQWEDLQIPFTIAVPEIAEAYLGEIRKDLRGMAGFNWQNRIAAAQYALRVKSLDEALSWAQTAVDGTFVGRENFQTLSTLADAQEAKGMTEAAAATRRRALGHATATAGDLHQYARRLIGAGKGVEAVAVAQLAGRRFREEWPVNVTLARAYSAAGRYRDALRHAKRALGQAPDDMNRRSLQEAVAKLERGEDIN